MVLTGRHVVMALLLAIGSVACTDDDVAPETTSHATEPAVTATPAVLAAAFDFAECMRDHGIEEYPDPQIRADGDYFLEPPAAVGDEELRAVQAECDHLTVPSSDEPDPDTTSDDLAAGWERVVPGGDCRCADGSEFSFWVRPADPRKVVFYLQDGGACFSAETCAPDRDLYTTSVDEGPAGAGGIFDFADQRNPFADHSVVYVPYCTGDVHLGNTTTEYAPGLTVHHKGFVNASAALDHLVAAGPAVTDVVVVGESAGSIAAPLYAGLVADRLPDARITVLADGSGAFPDHPSHNEVIAAWGLGTIVPAWPETADPTAEQWSVPGLFVRSGHHAPDIVFARHDYAYDERQQRWNQIVGGPDEDLLSLIDANEARIEADGVDLRSYIAPGDEHTVLSDGPFYTEEVGDVRLVDWVAGLIVGEPVDDVHCTECAPG